MTSNLHGQDLIGDEILKSFSAIQALAKFKNNSIIQDDELGRFMEKFSKIKTSNNRGFGIKNGLACHSKNEFIASEHNGVCNLIYAYDQTILENCFSTEKLTFNNIKFRTDNVHGRFNDSCVKVNGVNLFGKIKTMILFNNKVYCVIKRIKNIRCPFNAIIRKKINESEIKSHSFISLETNEMFVEEIQNLRKVFFYQWKNHPHNGIVSTLKSGHWFN
jgi:hypothetical protein